MSLPPTERAFSILNMRSVRDSVPTPDDATARARIRDAAIRLFAAQGFGVGVRAIAAEAGVSPALVLHHFGSKAGLRAACDAWVLDETRSGKLESFGKGGGAAMLAQLAELEEYGPLVAYYLRSMLAGGELAQAMLLDQMADATEYVAAGVAAGTVKPSRDEQARVRLMTLIGLGSVLAWIVLDPPDFADLGPWLRRYVEANGLAALELYTDGFFTDATMLDAYLEWTSGASPAAGPQALGDLSA